MSRTTDIINLRHAPGGDALAQFSQSLPPAPPAPAGEDESAVNVFKLLHSLLRGRYLLAIVLGLVLGAAGAAAGWSYRKPVYICTGRIHIKPTVTRPLESTADTLANYYSFQALQSARLRRLDVIEKALQSPEWQALGGRADPDAQRQFRSFLIVGPDPYVPELISVSFMHGSRQAAKVAVRELIRAYEAMFANIDDDTTAKSLEQARDEAAARVAALQKRIDAALEDYGHVSEDLPGAAKLYQDRFMKAEDTLSQLESELARRDTAEGRAAGGDPEPVPAHAQRTPEEIGAIDQQMQSELARRLALQQEIDGMLRMNLGQKHPQVLNKTDELELQNQKIENYAKLWNEQRAAGVAIDPKGMASTVETLEQLRARFKYWQGKREQYKAEAKAFGDKRREVEPLVRELAAARTDMDTRNQQLSRIRVETQAGVTGRISVESYGEDPEHKDSRPKWAGVGGFGGLSAGVGLVLLLGFIDRRRFRYSDEADVPNIALLGILPNLPKNLADPEQAAAAAHCVHRIRSLLQISGPAKKVYAITSSVAGDGKTSLTLSLGLSYAASGSRTLLIDFDMIGGGLTSSLNAKTDSGLADVLASGELNGHIVQTRTEGLSILPIGRNDERFASRLSASIVNRLIDSVRDQYDIILIDTGPILGSLEAAFVSASVDGVIMVVGRGQQRAHVERAVGQLRAVGGQLVGLVFNRATAFDFRKSVSSASIRSIGVYPDGRPTGGPSGPTRRLGPVASVVIQDVGDSAGPGADGNGAPPAAPDRGPQG